MGISGPFHIEERASENLAPGTLSSTDVALRSSVTRHRTAYPLTRRSPVLPTQITEPRKAKKSVKDYVPGALDELSIKYALSPMRTITTRWVGLAKKHGASPRTQRRGSEETPATPFRFSVACREM
jgi:hypothetical protein